MKTSRRSHLSNKNRIPRNISQAGFDEIPSFPFANGEEENSDLPELVLDSDTEDENAFFNPDIVEKEKTPLLLIRKS